MYKVLVEVKTSDIDGKGVFALEDILKGKVVWRFTQDHDKKLQPEQFNALSDKDQEKLRRTAYLSEQTGLWVYPPENDPACFTNHSKYSNLQAVFDPSISEEVVFVAKRHIEVGEELTNNYEEFDNSDLGRDTPWLQG